VALRRVSRGARAVYRRSMVLGGQKRGMSELSIEIVRYVDGIFEELDAPNEFFYDAPNQMLYYFYNGSGSPPSDDVFVATNLKVLINIRFCFVFG
jgi:hypothetical protein